MPEGEETRPGDPLAGCAAPGGAPASPPASDAVAGAAEGLPPEVLGRMARWRRLYIAAFLLMPVVAVLYPVMGKVVTIILYYSLLVVFLAAFLKATRTVLHWSTGKLVGLAIVAFIPLAGPILLLTLDFRMFRAVRREQQRAGTAKPLVSALAYWSVILAVFFIAVIGFPMALFALRAIGRSNGQLRGKTLAWIGVCLNGAELALIIVFVSIGLLRAYGVLGE